MANDTILQTAINLAPSAIRKQSGFLGRIASDLTMNPQNASLVGAKDEVITMKVPMAMTATDVVPGTPTVGDIKMLTKNLTLSYHRDRAFQINDSEFNASILAGVLPAAMEEAVKAVVNDVELKAQSLCWYKMPAFRTGDGTIDDLIQARTILNKAGVPQDNRSFVFSSGLDAKYQGVFNGPGVYQADPTGLAQGKFAPRMGFDMAYSNACDVSAFTAGTLADADVPIAKAATVVAVGATAVNITNNSNGKTLKKGDTLMFAGSDQLYSVTADVTLTTGATGYDVSISPTLRVALAGSEAVTVTRPTGAYASLAFHRNAIVLASRIPAGLQENTNPWSLYTDPITGLVLTLTKKSEYFQNIYSVACLFGIEIGPEPNLGMRVHYSS